MALGSTQPLTEMSTRCISWGKGGRCVRLTTLQPSCAVVMNSGNLNFLEPSGPLQACNGTALPFFNTSHSFNFYWFQSVVGITARYGLDGSDFELQGGRRFSLLKARLDRSSGPRSLLYNGYRSSFQEVKRPRSGVDLHLAPRLRMSGAIPLLTPCASVACYVETFYCTAYRDKVHVLSTATKLALQLPEVQKKLQDLY
jgi:hypothetical protein